MNAQEYLEFVEQYLAPLESLEIQLDKKDEKFAAELRTAERSFNFLLDNSPGNVVEDCGMEKFFNSGNCQLLQYRVLADLL